MTFFSFSASSFILALFSFAFYLALLFIPVLSEVSFFFTHFTVSFQVVLYPLSVSFFFFSANLFFSVIFFSLLTSYYLSSFFRFSFVPSYFFFLLWFLLPFFRFFFRSLSSFREEKFGNVFLATARKRYIQACLWSTATQEAWIWAAALCSPGTSQRGRGSPSQPLCNSALSAQVYPATYPFLKGTQNDSRVY